MRNFLILWLCTLLTACVSGIKPLGGGEKDSEPPVLLKTIYKNGKVILVFDENITLGDKSQIISNMYPEPEYEIKRNKLFISNLKATEGKQIIRFNSVVKDLNENNSLTNYNYVQNVGADTFSASGNVESLFSNKKTFNNCYVFLIDDIIRLQTKEDFYQYDFTKCNKEGAFVLDYIPNPIGKSIITFIDVNNNFNIDEGDYYDLKKIDSSLHINSMLVPKFIYQSNNDKPNILRIDTLSSMIIKTTLYDANLYRLQNPNAQYKYKFNKDSFFNFKLISDSLVLSNYNNIFKGNKIEVLSSYSKKINIKYNSAEIVENKSIQISNNKIDTVVNIVTITNDTLTKITIIADNKLSTLRFISNDTNALDSVYGFIYNNSSFYKIIKGKVFYKNNATPCLTKGQYKIFLYRDMNSNGKFDFPSLNRLTDGDVVIKNLKVIDIGAKMDVEISVKP